MSMRNEYSRDELWRIVGGVPEEYAAVVSQRDALMATAKSARWHAVFGSCVARLAKMVTYADESSGFDVVSVFDAVEIAKVLANQADEAWENGKRNR